jgi:DNA-binding MarR family transcriptional regulator
MDQTTDDDNDLLLCNQLCFAVYSAAHAFNRLYKVQLDALGLTYPQYLVMLVLWEGDGLMVKDLGERLRLDSGTLTPLLKRMEAAGLVHRDRDPNDERQRRISLSDRGAAMREQARAIPRAITKALGSSPEKLEVLMTTLLEVRDNLDAATNKLA